MNQRDKIDYLREHLRYELLMLRYSMSRMTSPLSVLEYNMAYEAFAIHARLLYRFLINKDGNNIKARDFGSTFEANKTKRPTGKLQSLNEQVMHLSKSRPSLDGDKSQLKEAQAVASWIETEFGRFVNSLSEHYRDAWNPDDADPSKVERQVLSIGPKGSGDKLLSVTGSLAPQATNAPTSVSTAIKP